MKKGAVIVAGGVGKRMNAGLPKQFIEINGRPIISHTLDRFLSAGVDSLVVVINSGGENELQKILKDYPPNWKFTLGGRRRQDSVLNGLNALDKDIDVVLIHDSARPFIRPFIIKKAFDLLKIEDAVLVALPSRDTVKEAVNGRSVGTISRDKIWLAQTPQGGKMALLKKAIENAGEITDDAMALEKMGIKPLLIEGDLWNFKITTKDDLVLAEIIARRIKEDESWNRI